MLSRSCQTRLLQWLLGSHVWRAAGPARRKAGARTKGTQPHVGVAPPRLIGPCDDVVSGEPKLLQPASYLEYGSRSLREGETATTATNGTNGKRRPQHRSMIVLRIVWLVRTLRPVLGKCAHLPFTDYFFSLLH